MAGECYYCRGIVLPEEPGDLLLDGHGDHRVYLHVDCAKGQNVVEASGADRAFTVLCPECGAVETVEGE